MNEEELLKIRKAYYNNTFVQFEIVKCLQNKEFAVLEKRKDSPKKLRYFFAKRVQFLKMHFEHLDLFNYNANFYHSASYLKDIPKTNYNLRKRTKEEEYIKFDKEYSSHVIGYDFFIDFDGKNDFPSCYSEAKEFKNIFDNLKVPYYMLNSSSNGFHFIIPDQYFSIEPVKRVSIIQEVVSNMKGIHSFSCLDETIVDIKRIKKLPYSFVDDGTIALPLTDEQFNTFSKEMVMSENVLKKVTIKNRGLLTRTHGLSEEQLKKNVTNFIKEYQ